MAPSAQEEKWIHEQEERKRQAERERHESAERAHREQDAVAERRSHYMKCPKCGHDLQEIEHEGIKVDRCTACSGIWLDPGELEEIEARQKGFEFFSFWRKK